MGSFSEGQTGDLMTARAQADHGRSPHRGERGSVQEEETSKKGSALKRVFNDTNGGVKRKLLPPQKGGRPQSPKGCCCPGLLAPGFGPRAASKAQPSMRSEEE